MKKITVLLVDDHRMMMEAWAIVLGQHKQFKVVGQATDPEQALRVAETQHPDIILTDINMSPMDGFTLTEKILEISPGSKVIGVSMHNIPLYAKKMLRMGGRGYVTKNSSKDELITAIQEVYEGNIFICKEIKDILANEQLDGNNDMMRLYSLTEKELDIIACVKQGLSSREIAEMKDVTLKTVEVHRYNILKKLGLPNTAALVSYIQSKGL
ncbi:MAG: DNA-binding response regulator [Citrobacter freundii]|nr:MAG: DNA-binding response regulator [Citrobacter freundii]